MTAFVATNLKINRNVQTFTQNKYRKLYPQKLSSLSPKSSSFPALFNRKNLLFFDTKTARRAHNSHTFPSRFFSLDPLEPPKSAGSFFFIFSSFPSTPDSFHLRCHGRKNRLTIRMHARSIDFCWRKLKEFWVKANVYLTDSSRVNGRLKR